MAQNIKIKQLEWRLIPGTNSWSAHASDRNEYIIIPTTEKNWRVYGIPGNRDGGAEYISLEAAKKAAQADYEQRILNAIEPSNAPARELVEAIERERLKWFCSGEDCTSYDHGRDEGFDLALKALRAALAKQEDK